MDQVINYVRRIVPATETEFFIPTTAAFPLSGASIDLWFSNNQYYDGGVVADATGNLSCSRASAGYAETTSGTLTQFSNDVLRITNKGLLVEETRTNVVLWDRDLTNAAWTPTNITPLKDQTGPDEVSNSASSLLATAGNGTILQSITLASSARFQSAYVKRLIGSGTVNMTMDNGATWTPITITSNWTRVTIPTQTLANPTVGFQIVTSGDKIAVDFVQNEDGVFISSPIATTTTIVARASDNITFINNSYNIMIAAAGSILFEISNILYSYPTVTNSILWSRGLNSYNRINGATQTNLWNNTSDLTATLGLSYQYGTNIVKTGSAWDAGGRSIVASNGTVATDANSIGLTDAPSRVGISGTPTSNPAFYGYVNRLSLWNSRLSDSTLQGFTVP